MKERELAKHMTCALCHKAILHSGVPLFWRVTIERFGVDINAVQRRDGLGKLLGSHALAGVMGPDEDMATPMMEPKVLAVCEPCALETDLPLAVLGTGL